ncbi:hypothetical protein DFH07DRAFT_1027337 [Mycena maculata]|uniref:DUF7928 domain-containing protein n=1 Tax=Mycena maculata TaxID=230809 RepID=A0AAD7NDJ2_9AGAR|nr:hypothetical protein DFH07DRAFT_1027337 [Mycena maculata]
MEKLGCVTGRAATYRDEIGRSRVYAVTDLKAVKPFHTKGITSSPFPQGIDTRIQGDAWFKASEENVSAGVCLRVESGHFCVFPYENEHLVPLEAAIRSLNPLVAIQVRSAAVHAALATPEDAVAIYIDSDTQIQILDTMNHLLQAEKEPFFRDERVLIVWSDNIDSIVPPTCEEKLMKLVWRTCMANASASIICASSATACPSRPRRPPLTSTSPKSPTHLPSPMWPPPRSRKRRSPSRNQNGAGWKLEPPSANLNRELEKGCLPAMKRVPFGCLHRSMAASELPSHFTWTSPCLRPSQYRVMLTVFLANGLNTLLTEWQLNHDYKQFTLMASSPFLVWFFFALQVISVVSSFVGPVAQYHKNSRYYSAIRPEPNREPGGFKRVGRFKKTSNMNYGLALSLKMEAKLAELEALECMGQIQYDEDKSAWCPNYWAMIILMGAFSV